MTGLIARERAETPKLVREIVTPEGIPLRFQLARASDRAGAFTLDLVIQLVVLVVISAGLSATAGSAFEGTWLTAVVTVLAFLLTNFYFAFFEIRWQGSTPGKRKVGIRVIDARGGQLEASAVLARNLVRELEVWMPLRLLVAGRVVWPTAPGWAVLLAGAWAVVFLLFPLFNKDRLRVGDLIAGTRVVMQPEVVLAPDLVAEQAQFVAGPRGRATYTFTEAQLGVYGIFELQVLEGVLRTNPASVGYLDALRTVADKIRTKLRYDQPISHDELFLRDFYAALRAHLEQKLVFGQRREDKFSGK
jgi:uncharacterized RDD family membrane protein YckC